jgi:hypothetical protein
MKKQTKAPIKVPNNQADQVQCIQPRTRKSDEIKLSVYDKFHESTTMVKIRTSLYDEDNVTFKSLSLVPSSKLSNHSHKYGQATVDIKPHIRRAFIKDDFLYLTVFKGIHDSDNFPPNVSTFQLESATKEEDADNRQGDGVFDDQDQKSVSPINKDTTHQSIAVGETHELTANIVKKAVEEHGMVESLKGTEERQGSLR